MKSSTLLQSFLLSAGLMLGGIPAVHADHAYTIVPSGSYLYNLLNDNYSPGQTPWWSSSQHNPGSGHFCNQETYSQGHHENHGRGDGHDHRDHWQHGKYDGRGAGHDHRDHRQHGKYDGRGDGHDHRDHRQHSKYDGRGDGHDQKGRKQHGKLDGRDDGRDHKGRRLQGKHHGRDNAGRKGQRSSSAGIGYTGRS